MLEKFTSSPVAVGLLILSTLGLPAAAAELFTASNGAEVLAPEIDTLACDEMNAALMAISASEYRGTMPLSSDHPDYPIYDYENRLAIEHYEDCQAGSADYSSPVGIFSSDFN